MDIISRIEEKTTKSKLLTIHISLRDRDMLVKTLQTLHKAKNDRLDGYILDNLIQALLNPEVEVVKSKVEDLPIPEQEESPVVIPPDKLDKVKIVNEIKARVDPNGKDELTSWIKNSIKFGQDQFGIKTVPKAINSEAFYDWLLTEGIIYADGRPNPNAGKK